MEADWEVELGSGAPIIDAAWSGFVDLRIAPRRVHEIVETALLPGLAETLVRLNAPSSPVWTAKCDVWTVEDAVDPFELDAEPGEDLALASYMDLLPRSDQQWHTPQLAAATCKALAARLHAVPLRACRIDLIVRLAQIAPGVQDLGITAYATACGTDESGARARLSAAVAAVADAVLGGGTAANRDSPLQ